MALPPPWVREIPYRTPVPLAAALAERPFTLLLDSAASGDARARYSYLAFDPAATVRIPPGPRAAGQPGPFAALRAALRGWRQATHPDLPPFQGGAAGLFGYELGGDLETLPAPHPTGARPPDLAAGIYDVVAAFDHVAERAWLISTGFPETAPAARARRAEARLAAGEATLDRAAAAPVSAPQAPPALSWDSDSAREAYLAKVRRAIEAIEAGEIFQVNLSRELVAPRPALLRRFAFYQEMRARTQAPFSAYLGLPDGAAVCSFSPERFLQVTATGQVETRPIKGTRPRGADPAEDDRLAAELAGSAKDRAENLMIVDLLRNDLARAGRIGTVRVPQLCGLERFGAVHHLVSVVTAELAPGYDALDLLAAAFPGGSITGAPKIRAMEIIHALEQRRRGPYCGALAWLGFDGAMDSSILIRTMTLDRWTVRYGVGGGIVADSDPEAEWRETEVKAAAFLSPPADSGAGNRAREDGRCGPA